MNEHRHVPPTVLTADSTVCLRCGQDIVWIAGSETRAGHWRAVRRVRARSSRSVSPSPARLDEGWTEPELREAYGR